MVRCDQVVVSGSGLSTRRGAPCWLVHCQPPERCCSVPWDRAEPCRPWPLGKWDRAASGLRRSCQFVSCGGSRVSGFDCRKAVKWRLGARATPARPAGEHASTGSMQPIQGPLGLRPPRRHCTTASVKRSQLYGRTRSQKPWGVWARSQRLVAVYRSSRRLSGRTGNEVHPAQQRSHPGLKL
jgi:hypothetical protein